MNHTEPITKKQMNLLKKNGIEADYENLTKMEAMVMIDELIKRVKSARER